MRYNIDDCHLLNSQNTVINWRDGELQLGSSSYFIMTNFYQTSTHQDKVMAYSLFTSQVIYRST